LKDVDDGCFVRVEPAGELFLQCFELFRQLARAKQRLAHFYESTDDKHAHLDRARAAKNIRRL